MDLSLFGWNLNWAAALSAVQTELNKAVEPARVFMANRGVWRVASAEGEFDASLSGAMLSAASDMRPVTGDWIALDSGSPRISAVLPRRTWLARKQAGRAVRAQPIAANLDVLFIVMGLDRDFNPRRLERYLLLAAEGGVTPVVVLNKSDLCEDLARRVSAAAALTHAEIVAISALQPGAAQQLHRYVEPGQSAALVGSSGTGKSTIVNALLGEARQTTTEVRDGDGRGRHTTTSRELFELPQGWLLMDTPGMRELEVWSEGGLDEAAFAATFADVAEVAAGCRFRDCRHQGEPGCAVARALEAGRLDPERTSNLARLRGELTAQERKRRGRAGSRAQNQMYRSGLRDKWTGM